MSMHVQIHSRVKHHGTHKRSIFCLNYRTVFRIFVNRDYFTNLYLEASSLKIEGQGEKGQNIIWLTFLYWALGEVGPPNIGCCPDQYRGTIGWGGHYFPAIGQTLSGHMAWSTAALSSARLTPLTVKDSFNF